MIMPFEDWADVVGHVDDNGALPLDTIVRHIRTAIIETGFVTRTRITSGLREAYRPFDIDTQALRDRVEEALRLLLATGDIDEFATAAGRAYTITPPRRVGWGGAQVAILGGVALDAESGIVRRLPPDRASSLPAVEISLADELGRPDWRAALVRLGGADAVNGDPATLFAYASSLAAGGERFALEPIETIAVLTGRGDFFGRPEPTPSGRWARVNGEGVFPAVVRTGYQARNVLLSISDGQATLWQPPNRDIWRWIVIGATLAQGDAVVRYDAAVSHCTFLTPPPRQLDRAVRLTGTQKGPWTWQVDPEAFAVTATLFRPRPGAGAAIATAS
jgi:hypothetical protein